MSHLNVLVGNYIYRKKVEFKVEDISKSKNLIHLYIYIYIMYIYIYIPQFPKCSSFPFNALKAKLRLAAGPGERKRRALGDVELGLGGGSRAPGMVMINLWLIIVNN